MSIALPFTRSIAVVIGIDAYGNGIPALRTAANDARRVGDTLEKAHGYELVSLIDADASLERLTTLFTIDLPARIGADDRLLVYFAGHGVALDGDDGPSGFIIPQDARRGDPSSYLSMPALHDALLALPARHLLLVLDCCFAGAFRWSATREIIRAPAVLHRERFDRFVRDPAWQVITSASDDQRANDQLSAGALGSRTGESHSPFATVILDALAGAGDVVPAPNGDGVITATELFLFVEDRLQPATIDAGKRQTPGLWPLRRHGKGEYVFLIPGREASLPPAPPLTFENNPYRGLESYDIQHAHLFFGRDAVIDALRARVATTPFTVVLGASGTGKSSVVKAGLVSALKGDASDSWHVLPIVRPGAQPLAALQQSLQSLDPTGPCSEELPSRWSREHPSRRLLLIVDQFEEVVTLCGSPEERTQVMSLIARIIEQNPTMRVVLTLRSDFEPQFASSPLDQWWTAGRYVVPPLSQSDLRQIIERPASERVLYFDPPTLVDTLIDEVVQTPGGLPLLSFTLSEMYVQYVRRGGDNRAVTRADYDSLGGVVGALRHRANQEFDALDESHRDTMRRLALRLVSTDGGTLVRRRVAIDELQYDDDALPGENARVTHVLDRLVEGRLAVRGTDASGEAYVEPAHDALVTAWDRLLGWIHDANSAGPSVTWRGNLARAANEWTRTPERERTGLLWQDSARSAQLNQLLRRSSAQRRTSSNATADWLNARERLFAHHSVRRRRRTLSVAVFAVLFIIAGAIASAFLGIQAKKSATAALTAAESTKVAGKKLVAQVLQSQANAIAVLARAEPNPQLRGLVLAEMHEAGLPAPAGGEALALQTMASLDSALIPTRLGRGWDFVESQSTSGIVHMAWMTVGVRREDGTPEFEVYKFNHVGDAEAAAIDPTDASGAGLLHGAAAAFSDHIVQYLSNNGSGTKPLRMLGAHAGRVTRVLFSDDGRWIVSGSVDGTARIWGTDPDAPTSLLDAHDGTVNDVAMSADGSLTATAHASGVSRVWSVNARRELSRMAHATSTRCIVMSADGQSVVSGYGNGDVVVWSAQTGKVRLTLKHPSSVDAVGMTLDGSGVIAIGGGHISIWGGDTPSEPLTASLTMRGITGPDWLAGSNRPFPTGTPRPRITVSRDGRTVLIVADTLGTLERWPIILPSKLQTFKAASAVSGIAFSGDGTRLVATLDSGGGRTFELSGAAAVKDSHVVQSGSAQRVAWNATITRDGAVLQSNHATRYQLHLAGEIDTSEHAPIRVEFSRDSSVVAVIRDELTSNPDAGFWQLSDGSKLAELRGGWTCIALEPHGDAVAYCPTHNTPDLVVDSPIIRSLRASRQSITIPLPDEGTTFQSAFSPNGKWLLLWGRPTADDLTPTRQHGAFLARTDGTGTPTTIGTSDKGFTSAAFSPDANRVALATGDGMVWAQPIDWDGIATRLRERVVACLTAAERVQFFSEPADSAQARERRCATRMRLQVR